MQLNSNEIHDGQTGIRIFFSDSAICPANHRCITASGDGTTALASQHIVTC
jgi:hypothetical protein